MNIKYFNSLFTKYKNCYEELKPILENIKSLENDIIEKKARNNKTYERTIVVAKEKEEYIKNNSDNKFNTFIKYIDFLNDEDIYDSTNFTINEKTGSLIKSENGSAIYIKPDTLTYSGDNIFLECTFNKSTYFNEINYEFYNNFGVPIVPDKITVVNEGIETIFYEPNFRYFNLNNKNFDNTFYFTAKKINSVRFYFSEPINKTYTKVSLRTQKYSDSIGDYIILTTKLNGVLNSYNIFKNSDEYNIPFKYSYSFDNVTYNDFEFDEFNKYLLTGTKGFEQLFIKIKSDYEAYNAENKYEIVLNNYKSGMIYSDEVIMQLNSSSTISYKITFTHSQYKKLKSAFDEAALDINNFINQNKAGVYVVNTAFLKRANTYDASNLYYYDDIDILKTEPEKFSFILDESKNQIFVSAFMHKFDYLINTESKNFLVGIDRTLFTPSIFDISIKG